MGKPQKKDESKEVKHVNTESDRLGWKHGRVALGKFLTTYVPQSPHLENGENNGTYLTELLQVK